MRGGVGKQEFRAYLEVAQRELAVLFQLAAPDRVYDVEELLLVDRAAVTRKDNLQSVSHRAKGVRMCKDVQFAWLFTPDLLSRDNPSLDLFSAGVSLEGESMG